MIYGDKKNTGWMFIIIGWLSTHTANTHLLLRTLLNSMQIVLKQLYVIVNPHFFHFTKISKL